MLVPKQNCHPDRSVAQWRDLRFNLRLQRMPFLMLWSFSRSQISAVDNQFCSRNARCAIACQVENGVRDLVRRKHSRHRNPACPLQQGTSRVARGLYMGMKERRIRDSRTDTTYADPGCGQVQGKRLGEHEDRAL